jgi:pimeloyl-ACP methyl ester carboxylesterase
VDERLDFCEFAFIQVLAFQKALYQGRKRAVKGVFERVKQFAALRLAARNDGIVYRDLALFSGLEQALGRHAVHEGTHGGIGPAGGFGQYLADRCRGAGLDFPNNFHDGPFGPGQFRFVLWHAGIISTLVEDVKGNIYKCRGPSQTSSSKANIRGLRDEWCVMHCYRSVSALRFFLSSVWCISWPIMEEKLELRVYGDPALPVLIYLPGLHGDWTLIGGFRSAVAGRVRFVEMAYPRTLTWSLDDYAAAIEEELSKLGITRGWLLGESFGSQPMWTLIARGKFQAQGAVLAGGFVRHPFQRFMRPLEKATGKIPSFVLVKIMFGYARFARIRYRRSPQTLATLDEFLARRQGHLDREAAQHRLHLVGQNDPRQTAMTTRVPIFGLTGILDPIVPWPPIRRWLKRNCPALRDYKIVRRADHNVLNTGMQESARWILEWMQAQAR